MSLKTAENTKYIGGLKAALTSSLISSSALLARSGLLKFRETWPRRRGALCSASMAWW